ncbi:MAG: hypothetical protein AAF998_15970 [Bacteroidota bacterium]
MKSIKFSALFLLLVLGLSSCKYEEGPLISFTPREERVANTWIVSRAVVNGEVSSSLSDFTSITFTKGGNDVNFQRTWIGIPYTLVGDWSFNDDNTIIRMNLVDEGTGLLSFDFEWTIRKLKEDELWVTYTEVEGSETNSYQVELVPEN